MAERGFLAKHVAAAAQVLDIAVAGRRWPGHAAAAGVGADVQCEWVDGLAEDWDGGQRPMSPATVFDLASLTKVLATAPAVLVLAGRREIDLDDPVSRYLDGVDPRVTVRHLLTHTSGLPAHLDLADRVSTAGELAAAAAAVPLETAPGERVRYSDLGFVLLGALIEAVTGTDLGTFAGRELLAPLGSGATFTPPPAAPFAATEVVDGTPVSGRVHDENAAAAGGPVGHAGLFGSLRDVRAAMAMWHPGSPVLADALRTEAFRDVGRPGGHRGLGWTCRHDAYDVLSDGWGDAAVSHTGFTGTSVALDPATGRWAVLLTNAVHYGRNRPDVLAARRRFHAALVGDSG